MEFTFVARAGRPPLDAFVDRLWYAHGQVPYGQERILPTGRMVLIFNLGAPFAVIDKTTQQIARMNRNSWLCGLQSESMLHEPMGETHMVGVSFRTSGAFAFFDAPADAFTDQIIDADALWSEDAELLREQAWHAETVGAKLDVVEAALANRLRAKEPPRDVGHALGRLAAEDVPPIANVASELAISQKHLAARFKRFVGMPPKAIARIGRLNRALAAMRAAGPIQLDALALDCGFYDQAHFNREFARFCGVTPTAYLRQRTAHFGERRRDADTTHFVPTGAAAPAATLG